MVLTNEAEIPNRIVGSEKDIKLVEKRMILITTLIPMNSVLVTVL